MSIKPTNAPFGPEPVVMWLKPDFTDPARIPRLESDRLVSENVQEAVFLNPLVIIRRLEDSEDAVQFANRYHGEWFRRVQRRSKAAWREACQREHDRLSLAYAFDGVVVTRGAVIPFAWWRDCFEMGIDASDTFTRRPEAQACLQAGDLSALEAMQQLEVERLTRSNPTPDGKVHVVFPHLTMNMPREAYLTKRVSREGRSWRCKIKETFGKEQAGSVPLPVRLGQIVAGDAAELLCREHVTRILPPGHSAGSQNSSRPGPTS